MSRRFLLVDLTPATRDLFRTFRDATRTVVRLSDVWSARHMLLQDACRDLELALRKDCAEDIRTAETRKDAAAQEYQRVSDEFNTAIQAVTRAFEAAKPALKAEGYPVTWWKTGRMCLPAGVESPGAHRRRKRA